MYFYQDHMLFHPDNTDIKNCFQSIDPRLEYNEIKFKDEKLRFISFDKNSKRSLVIYHGNATSVCNRLDFITKLNDLDLNIYLYEYPGFGNDTSEVNEKSILSNSSLFFQYLQTKNREQDFFLYGESLGTGVATYIASQSESVIKLFLQSPYTAISDIGQSMYPFLPIKLLLNNHFEMKEFAPKVKADVVMFYGGADKVIPNEISLAEYERFSEKKYKYFYPNQPHAIRYQNKTFWSDFKAQLKD